MCVYVRPVIGWHPTQDVFLPCNQHSQDKLWIDPNSGQDKVDAENEQLNQLNKNK